MPTRRILVVDDNAVATKVIRAMLAVDPDVHWQVVEAASARELFHLAAGQDPGTAQAFDIVVLDVHMPDVDGYTACRMLRAANQSLPVLFMTADRDAEGPNRARRAGGSSFLNKPFAPQAFREALHALTDANRG
jgi:CheY-like chemotaxis protein